MCLMCDMIPQHKTFILRLYPYLLMLHIHAGVSYLALRLVLTSEFPKLAVALQTACVRM